MPENYGEGYQYIDNWNQVKPGDFIIEDTFPEVYRIEVSEKGGREEMIGVVVGFQVRPSQRLLERLGDKIVLDFSPDFMYDQPWLKVSHPAWVPEND